MENLEAKSDKIDETLNLDDTLDLHFPGLNQNENAPNSFFRGG